MGAVWQRQLEAPLGVFPQLPNNWPTIGGRPRVNELWKIGYKKESLDGSTYIIIILIKKICLRDKSEFP